MGMGEYGNLSDQERRKLYRDFSNAAKEIKVERTAIGGVKTDLAGAQAPAHAASDGVETERRERESTERFLFHRRRRKRPLYRVRLKIDSYAYSEGFEIGGLPQFLISLLAFLWPNRDPVPRGFVKVLVFDSARRGDPEGYGLARTLEELQKLGTNLLKGGGFLRRDSDRGSNLRTELAKDLLQWEAAGYRLINGFQKIPPRLSETLETLKVKYEQQKNIDVFELTDVVKGVYRITLAVQAEPEMLRERLLNAGELIKGLYKRIYTDEERIHQVCGRIDHQVSDFLSCYDRLKWFAAQLYPALLKMLNTFCRQEEVASILAKIYAFVGMDGKDVLVLRAEMNAGGRRAVGSRGAGSIPERTEVASEQPEPEFDFNEEFRGILTILDYAFPGCRAWGIWEGDYSILLWFYQKIFSHRDYRGSLLSRRPDIKDLLWKVSRRDPLAPVIVLYELIAKMMESLNPQALIGLGDPLTNRKSHSADSFVELRRQWRAVREELLLRYLREVDYFEKEVALHGQEVQSRFLNSPAARKTIETVNQIRNHIIRGYGHVALSMDRKGYFRCRPLYALVIELNELLNERVVDRDQLNNGNPIPAQRYEREDLIERQSGPMMNQIHSYIEALPEARRILQSPKAEYNRVFLEILSGLAEVLDFLLNDERSRLNEAGAEVFFAAGEERRILNEIENDKTPLRVDLRKDFEEIDRLTGLFSKNEYLRFMPALFDASRQGGQPLCLMVMDLDRFKAINDTRGHDFGDEILKLAAEVILSSGRAEDPGVRFGGDELLVVVKVDIAAALAQAERIRSRYFELLKERFAQQLEEIPLLMAQKELAEKKQSDPLYRGGIEDFLERWKGRGLGTLSVGVAQGLGKRLKAPCKDEKELFRRADKILYLAKESGGNRCAAMFDVLEIPLIAAEYKDFVQYLEPIPPSERAEAARRFVDLRLANNQAPLFWNYPYRKYIEDV